jgi:Domain of unknown function (DUF1906)
MDRQAAEKLVCGERTVYSVGCSDSGDTSSCASLVASARFSAACRAVPSAATLETRTRVKALRAVLLILAAFLLTSLYSSPARAAESPVAAKSYLGFDRNEYPGDAVLPALRRDFAYAGYWLNKPPGASDNSWTGKRTVLRAQGLGFLILFNGRLDSELKGRDAVSLGRADAQAAISAASKEGFPSGALIFLDQEEGGRLLPEQGSYLFAWVDEVRKSSRYRAGVYCSGIEVPDGSARISTAMDIRNHERTKRNAKPIPLWVAQDECPPSPGCLIPHQLPSPDRSGVPEALVWQYTQSPRRPQFTAKCAATYAADGECYAPGLPHNPQSFLDLDVSESADPSSGR